MYDGSGELRMFELWVSDLLRWFRLHGILRPDVDQTCINVIGHASTGAAKDWFHYRVENSEQGPEGWNTLEVIQGLQRQFITQKSLAEAVQDFCTLTQGSMATVELRQELRMLGMQLPSEPDAYTFRKRFMEALHPRIAQ
jgi:hypothetical protein